MLSKEEKEMYEKQIKLIKEATEELKESNDSTLQKCNCETCFTPDELMETEDMVWVESLDYVCEQCYTDNFTN